MAMSPRSLLTLCALSAPSLSACALVLGISEGELGPTADGGDDDGSAEASHGDGTVPSGDATIALDAGRDSSAAPTVCGALIDNFDDGTSEIPPCVGRVGRWAAGNDTTKGGVQVPTNGALVVPAAGGVDGGGFAAHTTGKGFIERGADIHVMLNTSSNIYEKGKTYDASHYSGITFWAKSKTLRDVYINFPDRSRYTEDGVCKGTLCGDYYGDGQQIGTTWSKKTVKFSQINADVDGGAAFDSAHLYGIEFHIAPKSDAGAGAAFDFWIDDVAFIP